MVNNHSFVLRTFITEIISKFHIRTPFRHIKIHLYITLPFSIPFMVPATRPVLIFNKVCHT